ncbi:MAG: acetyltransferase [Ignavibacteria bacterium]|nr:acetyltransferase [Ignavibacteria bacterium]
MKRIALVGYGELALQIERLILQQSSVKPSFCYFDDVMHSKNIKNSFRFDDHLSDEFAELEFYVCLGYKHLRKKKTIIEQLLQKERKLPALIHKTAYISPGAMVMAGAVIYPMCNVDKGAVIGSGTILNNSVVVSHDSEIGKCCFLSPGAVTSGFVKVGDCSFIGSASVVSNYVNVGKDCIIAIGSVVTKDLPAGSNAVGNPLKILKEPLELN